MAFTSTVDFVGQIEQEIYNEMFLAMDSVDNDMVTVRTGIKGRFTLTSLTVEANPKLRVCEFEATDDSDIAPRILLTAKLHNGDDICDETMAEIFDQNGIFKPRAGASNNEVDYIRNRIMDLIPRSMAEKNEQYVWQAVSGVPNPNDPLTLFDGFFVHIDNATYGVAGQPVITPANAIDELTELVNLIPQRIRKGTGDRKLYIGVNYADYQAIESALYTQNYNIYGALTQSGNRGDNSYKIFFRDLEIKLSHGIPANRMFISHKQNLVLGTDEFSDRNSFMFKDMRDSNLNLSFRYRFNYDLGTQVRSLNEIVVRKTV